MILILYIADTNKEYKLSGLAKLRYITSLRVIGKSRMLESISMY